MRDGGWGNGNLTYIFFEFMNLRDFLPGTNDNRGNNESCFPTLSYTERMIGFVVCFVIGKVP